MPGRRILPPLVGGACLAVFGCERIERSPVAPTLARLSDAAAAAMPALAAGGGQASGHALVHGTTVQNVKDESYSFTAVTHPRFPQAKGEVEGHWLRFTGESLRVHADVICMAVRGDTAWVGGRVTELVSDGVKVPNDAGRDLIFRVVDRGQGQAATDAGSLIFFPFPGARVESAESYCETQPNFPVLFSSEQGNIQVKPR